MRANWENVNIKNNSLYATGNGASGRREYRLCPADEPAMLPYGGESDVTVREAFEEGRLELDEMGNAIAS